MRKARVDLVSELRRQWRGWLGFEVPPAPDVLGTGGQVRVKVTLKGVSFETTAFPTGFGAHFVPTNKVLRRRLGLTEGERVKLTIESASPRPPVSFPAELRAELVNRSDARLAWEGLTPAAKRMASTWIGGARSAEVRRFRSRDVVRRAIRYREGKGPFYPTQADQRRLGRRRGKAGLD